MPKEVLTEIYNKLCYVDWVCYAQNILDQKPEQPLWFHTKKYKKVSRYRKSIVNVIGHAIADCMTRKNEFEDKRYDKPRVIVFTTGKQPEEYTRANWNAVVLYNLVDCIINDDKHTERGVTDVYEYINKSITDYHIYEDVLDLYKKVSDSINDIKQYDKAVGLIEMLKKYKEARNKSDNKVFSTPFSKYDLEKIGKEYSKEKAVTIQSPYHKVNIPLQSDKKITMNLTLKYDSDPCYLIDNTWSVIDNGSLKMPDSSGKIISGKYRNIVQRCNPNYWNYLIQILECDFEFEAAELRDYKLWSNNPAFDYEGMKVDIESINKNDQQYHTKEYNLDDYVSYMTQNPKNRPMPIEE